MSKFSNTVEYSLKTTLDSTGITKLQNEIRNTYNEINRLHSISLLGDAQTKEALTQLKTIEQALTKAFNPNLGMLDSKKLNSELKSMGVSIQNMYKTFSTAGVQGQMAFNNLIGTFGKVDTGLKSISKTTDKVFNTIGNTVRWGVVASGFQGIMNSAHEAVNYVKELDRSLTDIMMVTEYSKEQMNEYARSANDAAKALGSTTVAMTDATLVFAQQGFELPESSALAERSTKLANASQQQTSVTSDQITAMMNAYGIEDSIAEIDKSLDSWAEVANVSAADVKEIAVGFQKAGSTAATVGVSMDQLNAQIAAIESVTREAPENIGNGLKTLYARFADIGMGETLDDGVDLGQVTKTLNDVGVEVLNAEGKMNNVGDIMEDLMDVWATLDMTQKNAIATTLAGKYQLSRFEALMNRSDLYEEYKTSSENAEDTLDTMNEKYVNSLAGRMNALQASFEGIVLDVLDTDDFYDIIGALTETLDLFNDLIDAIGGGGQALTAFGTIATKVFSKNLAAGLTNMMSNVSMRNMRENNVKNNQNLLRRMGAEGDFEGNERTKALLDRTVRSTKNDDVMTVEQLEARNKLLQQSVDAENKLLALETSLTEQVEATNAAYKLSGLADEDIIQKKHDDIANRDYYDFSELQSLENTVGISELQISQEFLETDNAAIRLNDSLYKIGQSLAIVDQEFKQGMSADEKAVLQTSAAMTKLEAETERLGNIKGPKILSEKFFTLVEIQDELATEIGKGTEASETRIQELINTLQEANREAIKLIENTRKGNFIHSAEEGENQQGEVHAAETTANSFAEQMDGDIGKIDTQARVQSIIDAAAAVGQLAFAVQSFQSLGSIWQNQDLTDGEKIQETILNLTMSLPMLLSGLTELQKGWQKSAAAASLAKKADDLKAAAAAKAAAAQMAEGRATLFAGSASRIAAASVKGLSVAINALGGPIGVAMMLLSGFAAVVGAVQEHDKELKEAEYEKAESMRESAKSAIEATKD